jgi:hypothetical protein
MAEANEQQSGCARCEALRIEALDEYHRRLMEASEFLHERLVEIALEHDRGEHAEDAG